MPFGLPELASAVRQFLAENLPGRTPKRVCIFTFEDAEPLSVPVQACAPAPPQAATPATPTAATAATAANIFVPDTYQLAILEALDGKALRTAKLASATGGDERRLFRHPGGLRELREHGLIESHPRLGYYRPDSLPPQLIEE